MKPLYYKGDIWLSYSGSHCMTPNYGLGLLRYNGGDPLQRSSWDKDGRKYFSQANGNYGTGHNCFFSSPDGTQVWVSRLKSLIKRRHLRVPLLTAAPDIRMHFTLPTYPRDTVVMRDTVWRRLYILTRITCLCLGNRNPLARFWKLLVASQR